MNSEPASGAEGRAVDRIVSFRQTIPMNDVPKEPFSITVRVPYADTDQMNMVYHGNYLVYFEMARTELLRAYGLPYAKLEEMGVLLPVIEAHCAYRSPARYDDLLTVQTTPELLGAVRFRMHYTVLRDGERLVTGYTDHACVGRDGRPLRMHPELLSVVSKAIAERSSTLSEGQVS
jgi:acyl-CoA thioester hydrolase